MKKKVVVVEDDESISDIIQIILEREGYSTINCRDGNAIFNGSIEVPDLYLIDRLLSGIDGLEICDFLKSQPSTNDIPIIIMSATPGIENMVKNAGADGFIEKPFSKKHLVQTVKVLLGITIYSISSLTAMSSMISGL
jgi:DNA-binding response OmpR family regulator